MKRLLAALFPKGERRAALWLALGGTAVIQATHRMDRAVADALSSQMSAPSAALALSIRLAAATALAMFVVLALVRLAKAPRVLTLFLAATGAASVLLGLPRPDARDAGVALGALAAGWLADWVTLDRIKAFPESDTDEPADSAPGAHELVTPDGAHAPLAFLGWEGWPAQGDALMAIVFALSGLASGAIGIAVWAVATVVSGGDQVPAAQAIVPILQIVGLGAVAFVATSRSGVRTWWLVLAASIVAPLIETAMFVVSAPGIPRAYFVLSAVALMLMPLAAVSGTVLALRREAATLPAGEGDDPGRSAPDDTAGGTDG